MVCRPQGRGLRRDTSQIGCDLVCVVWKLGPMLAKETSQLFNAIRQLFVFCECGTAAGVRSNFIFENGLGKAQPNDTRVAWCAGENREFDGDCLPHALRVELAFQRQAPWRPPVSVKGTRTEGDFSLTQARDVN